MCVYIYIYETEVNYKSNSLLKNTDDQQIYMLFHLFKSEKIQDIIIIYLIRKE